MPAGISGLGAAFAAGRTGFALGAATPGPSGSVVEPTASPCGGALADPAATPLESSRGGGTAAGSATRGTSSTLGASSNPAALAAGGGCGATAGAAALSAGPTDADELVSTRTIEKM